MGFKLTHNRKIIVAWVTMFIVGPIGFLGVVQNVNGQRRERMYYKRVLQQEERQKELEEQR